MVPRLVQLCERAAAQNISLTIDAEEADRLHLSLEIIAALLDTADFGAWQGLGFAVQAYQKRSTAVIDYLAALARAHKKRLHLRLIKGAYWDSEIKRAQERGWDDFPVYTRKAGTDVSYLACVRRMLEASEWIDPVFGSHNAMTVAHIAELARGATDRLEFQHLHGMGEELYDLMQKDGFNVCVYAPVGNHDVLLGYLVRRILENGANSSFVHRLLDRHVSVGALTADPVEELRLVPSIRHPLILKPPDLYEPERRNSQGLDLADPYVTQPLLESIAQFPKGNFQRGNSDPQLVSAIFRRASAAFPSWANTPVKDRAAVLDRLSNLIEANRAELMALLVNEANKAIPDAAGEVREATDFCRYYAARARVDFTAVELPGPVGERNQLRLLGRGVFVCISPWNFPLAIFLGQVAAALVAGNCVIAKPAPQTPQIALRVAQLFNDAGLPHDVLHVLPGGTDIGTALVQHKDVAGVAFTGSTATAQTINRSLAMKQGPIVPLIAETGGQNALIVDTSSLPEQVIDDVLTSSFRSAGQRCSALRVLCLPEPTADKILTMLKGAMAELRVGDPGKLEIDVGPIIDKIAQQRLLDHVAKLKQEAKEIYSVSLDAETAKGTFVAPQAWEIPSIGWLKGEVFGPILHVVRYRPENLSQLIAEINTTGFGLTGGVHSRIEETVAQVTRELHAGNLYVNRSLIGAVVGVQPFGGEGLSGTGPKAGGPHYLPRFATERVVSINTTAAGGNASLMTEASD
jgi:RHH-type proline utilization regulon transcriptional repressor/proline dehydrogenase/delta 1-pyrroline-5-carboxylate dehydrogenase